MKFALLGGGVVGQCYGGALIDQGHSLHGVLDIHPSSELQAFVAKAGATIHPIASDWLAGVDCVVSAVYGTDALAVAREAFSSMRPGSLYIDMTTATPLDMATADREASLRDVAFVDVAITGAVNLRGRHTPLLCAGRDARRFVEAFAGIGSPIKVVSAKPGDAAHLKLLRSIFAKGLEALTIECLTTAEVAGLRPALHEVLLDIDQTPLQKLMEALVTTHVEHAGRRYSEVIEAAALMRASGLQPIVLGGVQALFERTKATLELHPAPAALVDASLQWLVSAARQEHKKHADVR